MKYVIKSIVKTHIRNRAGHLEQVKQYERKDNPLIFQSGGDAVGPEYHGWIAAYDPVTRKRIGYVDYSYWQGESAVTMIEVEPEYRNKGVGSQLLAKLQSENEKPVKVFGDFATKEGQGLWNKFNATEEASEQHFESLPINPPKNTIKAYKLFRTLKNRPGEIFPLFIGNQNPVPIGEWMPAKFIPTKGYSNRPGWHAGKLPSAPHLMTRQGTMPEGRVWAEVEIPNDVEWQSEANKQKTRDIRDKVPEGGYYRFPRPAKQGFEWLIAGALKVNRLLTNEEAKEITEGATV